MGGDALSSGPAGAPATQRRVLCRRQRRLERRARAVHPASEQRHRGHPGLARSRPGTVCRSDRRLRRALVLVRSDPSRVDSAGDAYTLAGWPTKRGHGQPTADWTERPLEDVFAASGSSAFYRAEAIRQVGGFDPLLGSYYEDVDLGFRLRWAGYRSVFDSRCRILHEISATYDHAHPGLQRRIARNAELVFWSNLPARHLAAAILPHAALLITQAGWRVARLRFIPFFLGKIDAVRSARSIHARRKHRADLARSSIAPAHFPLRLGSIRDVLDHLRRPRERSARKRTP